jgi:hypothetical protein
LNEITPSREFTVKTLPNAVGSWENLTHDVSAMFGFPTDILPEQFANA